MVQCGPVSDNRLVSRYGSTHGRSSSPGQENPTGATTTPRPSRTRLAQGGTSHRCVASKACARSGGHWSEGARPPAGVLRQGGSRFSAQMMYPTSRFTVEPYSRAVEGHRSTEGNMTRVGIETLRAELGER